ncbi:hypothetical protein CRM22_009161 [Opisthorchis felineus]|uniref:Nuclear cap-binding protein subunit 3 n=1 Tax=Opisthorchis felineus TaxID=147828 RepID=A0A4S2L8T0_OPIFE|nr:hypothetical protein CRM22_009161 [Opisthorchis felineus]TGZ59301.1 hypothetical protein CRM22_009161 [Opisthorchis felineus]
MLSVSGLKVTIDVDMSDERDVDGPDTVKEQRIYCSCQSEYCDCGSDLGVTEASAHKVYVHLGFPGGRDTVQSKGYRETALHIWGTHNLSTDEVLSWLSHYNPINIEWINDASCNVVFSSPNTVLRVICDFAEPFDRRVALAAAAALAALLEKEDEDEVDSRSHRIGLPSTDGDKSIADQTESDAHNAATDLDPPSLQVSSETLDSIEAFSQYLPPSGRWFKALSVPSKTVSLFLRFAHITDVKLPGAERRSLYYRRYGNPNYGGMTGILSRSYRRRLQGPKKKTDSSDIDSCSHDARLLTRDLVEEIAKAYENTDTVSGIGMPVKKVKLRAAFMNPDAAGPAPDRQLVVYDNVYDVDEEEPRVVVGISDELRARIGTRREAVDFPTPKSPKQPRKWPRRDRGPAPNRWLTDDYSFSPPSLENINVVDLREPWMREEDLCPPHRPFVFSGKQTDRRVRQDELNGTTTITLMPDVEPPLSPGILQEDDNSHTARRLLASMSMVADMEEKSSKNRPVTSRLGYRKNQPPRHRTRDVWQRLG